MININNAALSRKFGDPAQGAKTRLSIILIVALFMPFSVSASITCKGHFVNPITDILSITFWGMSSRDCDCIILCDLLL
ncbi:hypothetical protein [Rickettsia endosymbiont of Culicoides newsteadi]|uniref:hypothetical protein n=1 Tax=Rickettsia endosymbiont of Culicoides newsteadi TaxID=1961830 RepID=UPI0012FF5C47|nr:hypothetical protein [Rickettsia endosymbiont of Culicoides newsteadi]